MTYDSSTVMGGISFISGAVGGFYSTVVGHPFDTLKSRVQTNSFKLYKYRNLYNGFAPHASIQIISNSVLFGVYDYFKLKISGNNCENIVCYPAAVTSGLVESLIYTPLENIKVRQQLKMDPPRLNTIFNGFKYCMARECLGNCIYLGSYFNFKEYFISNEWSNDSSILISGGLSGMFYWLFMHPIDTYKTLIQTNRLNLLNNNNYSFLYNGIGWCLLRSIPFNCCTFYGYETTRSILTDYYKTIHK